MQGKCIESQLRTAAMDTTSEHWKVVPHRHCLCSWPCKRLLVYRLPSTQKSNVIVIRMSSRQYQQTKGAQCSERSGTPKWKASIWSSRQFLSWVWEKAPRAPLADQLTKRLLLLEYKAVVKTATETVAAEKAVVVFVCRFRGHKASTTTTTTTATITIATCKVLS